MTHRARWTSSSDEQTSLSSKPKVFWLSGVIPLALFMIWQRVTCLGALSDGRSVIARMPSNDAWPYWVGELLLLYLPLTYHAVYGCASLARRSSQPESLRPLTNNQRAHGAIAFLAFSFIAYHLYKTRICVWSGQIQQQDVYQLLCAELSTTSYFGLPLYAFAYLIGFAACARHLRYGLGGFWQEAPFGVSQRARSTASFLFSSVAFVLFVVAAQSVVFVATGSHGLYFGVP